MAEGVAGLGLGGVAEEPADLGIALDVGDAGEVEVAAVRLALAGEGVLQVLVGLAALSDWPWLVLSLVRMGSWLGMSACGRRLVAAAWAEALDLDLVAEDHEVGGPGGLLARGAS